MPHLLRFLVIAAMMLALSSPLRAQAPTQEDVTALTYVRQGSQGPIVARIEICGDALTGTIDFAGQYTSTLNGRFHGKREGRLEFIGRFNLTRVGGASSKGTFAAGFYGDTLDLVLLQEASATQRAGELDIRFARVRDGATVASASSEDAGTVDATLDQRLVGNWVRQSLIVSGGASMASEYYLVLRPDGTYVSGSGRSVAGGGDWSYNGGNGSVGERGRWQAQDGVLYFGENGQWRRVGKYGMTSDGSTMRITYANGNKVLWNRQ